MSSVEIRKDLFADERDDDLNEVGQPTIRQDIRGHVLGTTRYYDDFHFDGLLHMRCVRSPHHHARIRSIDTTVAEKMPGVKKVVMPHHVPNNLNTLLSLIGFGRDDEPLLSPEKVAYKGEPVCAVIADTDRQARAAVVAINVDWEVLPHVLDVEEALMPEAPVVNETYPNNTFDYGRFDHQKLRFGDVKKAMAKADKVVEGEYQMSPIEQAPMETCGAIAAPEINDRYVCHTSTQALFFSLGTTAKFLDIPSSRLHFKGGTVGGGFGGKVDSIVEPMSVLGAVLTGKPVKFHWDREEEMQVGAPRGAERWYVKDGVMNDGTIVARELTGFFDSGAYTRLSSYAIQKGVGHLPGPYTIPNVAANVYCVFTNRTPATAMRGFGITGVDFAIEAHMDKVAEAVNMNPIELRIHNAYRDGDMKVHRRLAKNTALVECCQVAAEKARWPIRPQYAAQSSLTGGGTAQRASIPETVVDSVGTIGQRKTTSIDVRPDGASQQTVPAGQGGVFIPAVAPQHPDMQIDPARVGHSVKTPEPLEQAATLAPSQTPLPSPLQQPPPYQSVPHGSAQQRSTNQYAAAGSGGSASPSGSEPAGSASVAKEKGGAPSTGETQTSASPASPASQGASSYQPEKPFNKGMNRPGAHRHLINRRRR